MPLTTLTQYLCQDSYFQGVPPHLLSLQWQGVLSFGRCRHTLRIYTMDLEPTEAGFRQKSSIKQNQQHTTSVNNGKTTELSPKKSSCCHHRRPGVCGGWGGEMTGTRYVFFLSGRFTYCSLATILWLSCRIRDRCDKHHFLRVLCQRYHAEFRPTALEQQ